MWLFERVILETPSKLSVEAYVNECGPGPLLAATGTVPLDL